MNVCVGCKWNICFYREFLKEILGIFIGERFERLEEILILMHKVWAYSWEIKI